MDYKAVRYEKYLAHLYKCIDAYKEVDNPDEWEECPRCQLKPLVWEYNNGRHTACRCGESKYEHFSISAPSILSVARANKGSVLSYNRNELRDNWNEYVRQYKCISVKQEIQLSEVDDE